ncbi:MAG: sterol desaturase family protein [Alphaproteobacteria bacterium]|jgi:sterol desaturase/sphingolipid hydroxylase (fatty acid hydroxylase superfamily)|nr:sterol desaturase family protein [Alphaproteobacteria bacterium]MDP6815297.1 sterol desaturase family protein [Alphaproteobacteria bacterium]
MDPANLEGPFKLVFHAVEALVRPLFAFNQYDSLLYWPFLAGALVLSLLVFILARPGGGGFLRGYRHAYFTRAVWGHPSAKADYRFYYVNGVLFPLVFAPLIVSGAWVGELTREGLSALAPPSAGGESGLAVNLAYTLVFFLAYDFGRFLAHYIQHRFDILWHFHKVHHSAEVLTPFTSYRVHPIDLILMASGPALLTGLVDGLFGHLFGSAAGYYLFYGLHALIFIYNLIGNLRHTHVWLSYGPVFNRIFVSPAQHQIHHSIEPRHWGQNIGFALAFWDRMFGTLYVPEGHEQFDMGLGDGTEAAYHSVRGMYWRPVRELFSTGTTSHGL